MTRGIGFRPKFDISITVRDVPDDHARSVSKIFDNAILEVGDYARITRGESLAIETQMDIARPNLNLKEMEDQWMEKALHETGNNVAAAATKLGKSQRTVYRWLRDKGKEAIG